MNRARMITRVAATQRAMWFSVRWRNWKAVQVLCYELRMAALDPGAAPGIEFEPATHEQIEGFYAHLDRAITASGFFNPANSKRLWPRLRRLFGRIRLEKDEVNILRGMLSAFEKK